MSTYNYTFLQATALKLLKKYGDAQIVKTRTNTGTEYDPTFTETAEEMYAVKSDYRVGQIDGTLVKENDIKFLVYHTSKIADGSLITYDGKDYSVVRNEVVQPSSVMLLQKIQARA